MPARKPSRRRTAHPPPAAGSGLTLSPVLALGPVLALAPVTAPGATCNPTDGCRSEAFGIDDTGLTFRHRIADTPTPKNCPGYAGFMETTGSAAMAESPVSTFATRAVTGRGKRQRTARR